MKTKNSTRTPRQIEASKKNLEKARKARFQTGKEAAEAGRRGGVASGEAKREKGRLRSALEMLLDKDYSTTKGDVYSGAELVAVGLFNRAKSGDPRAVKLLAEMIEEYKQTVDLTANGQPVNVVVQNQEAANALQTILANARAGKSPEEQKAAQAKPAKPAKPAKK